MNSQNTCRQFYELSSILPKGYKGNGPTDLRPKGMSSRRHTDETEALFTTRRLAKLALPKCTRHQEEAQKKKTQNT